MLWRFLIFKTKFRDLSANSKKVIKYVDEWQMIRSVLLYCNESISLGEMYQFDVLSLFVFKLKSY